MNRTEIMSLVDSLESATEFYRDPDYNRVVEYEFDNGYVGIITEVPFNGVAYVLEVAYYCGFDCWERRVVSVHEHMLEACRALLIRANE